MAKNGNKNAVKVNNTLINTIVIVLILVFVAVGVYATYGKIAEGLEDKAIANGEKEPTVAYLAKQSGMSVEDYLAQYGLTLGEAVTNDTTETEMLDNMTLENYLKYNGDTQTADEVLEGTGLTDKATKDTLWKDFLPMVPVVSVIGEESFNQIKEQLGLGDEVTAETPYGEFEKLVEDAAAAAEGAENTEATEEDSTENSEAEAETPAAE